MMHETLIHIDQSLSEREKNQFIKKMCDECGGTKPRHHSTKDHLVFLTYDDTKIAPHDLPAIAQKHGARIEIVDF